MLKLLSKPGISYYILLTGAQRRATGCQPVSNVASCQLPCHCRRATLQWRRVDMCDPHQWFWRATFLWAPTVVSFASGSSVQNINIRKYCRCSLGSMGTDFGLDLQILHCIGNVHFSPLFFLAWERIWGPLIFVSFFFCNLFSWHI